MSIAATLQVSDRITDRRTAGACRTSAAAAAALQALSSNISFNVRPCLPGQSISSSSSDIGNTSIAQSSSNTLCYMCAAPFFSFNAYQTRSGHNSSGAAAGRQGSGSGAERLQVSFD